MVSKSTMRINMKQIARTACGQLTAIGLGHLCSGIIDELADDDANHIGGEWHTMSKKKNSSQKKKVQGRHVTNFKTRSSI
jgi:hypothetical protein